MGHYTTLTLNGRVRPELAHVLDVVGRIGWAATFRRFPQYEFLEPDGRRAGNIAVGVYGDRVEIDAYMKDGFDEGDWIMNRLLPAAFIEVDKAVFINELDDGNRAPDSPKLATALPSRLGVVSDEDAAAERALDELIDGGHEPPDALVAEYFKSSSPVLRWAIARACTRVDRWLLGDPEEQLVALLDDDEAAIRGAAACALCRDDYWPAADHVRAKVSNDPDPLVRRWLPSGRGVTRIVGSARIRADLAPVFKVIAALGWKETAERFPQLAFLKAPYDGVASIVLAVGDDHVSITLDTRISEAWYVGQWFAQQLIPNAVVAIDSMLITEDGVTIAVGELAPDVPSRLATWTHEELEIEARFDALPADGTVAPPVAMWFMHESPLVRWAAVRAAHREAIEYDWPSCFLTLLDDPEPMVRGACFLALLARPQVTPGPQHRPELWPARDRETDPLVKVLLRGH